MLCDMHACMPGSCRAAESIMAWSEQLLQQGPGPECMGPEQEMEAFYRQVHALEGAIPEFPKHYPRAALLGCVWVADCLPVRRAPALATLLSSSDVLHMHGQECPF